MQMGKKILQGLGSTIKRIHWSSCVHVNPWIVERSIAILSFKMMDDLNDDFNGFYELYEIHKGCMSFYMSCKLDRNYSIYNFNNFLYYSNRCWIIIKIVNKNNICIYTFTYDTRIFDKHVHSRSHVLRIIFMAEYQEEIDFCKKSYL